MKKTVIAFLAILLASNLLFAWDGDTSGDVEGTPTLLKTLKLESKTIIADAPPFTLFVSPLGAGDHSGVDSANACTPEEADSIASPGDYIFFMQGLYTHDSFGRTFTWSASGAKDNPIILIGVNKNWWGKGKPPADSSTVFMNSENQNDAIVFKGDWVTVLDMIFYQDFGDDGMQLVQVEGDHMTFEGCSVIHNVSDAGSSANYTFRTSQGVQNGKRSVTHEYKATGICGITDTFNQVFTWVVDTDKRAPKLTEGIATENTSLKVYPNTFNQNGILNSITLSREQ